MVSENSKNKLTNKVSLYTSRSSHKSSEMNKTGSWRFSLPVYKDKTAPCSASCPAGIDIPQVEIYLAKGEIKKAWEKLVWENPMPAVCGRVCFHQCEEACNRKDFDSPVGINSLEKFIGDIALSETYSFNKAESEKSKKIAIIGAGPSGLSAGYFLSRLGYSCEIFEKESEPGGVMRWGIPSYRLPKRVLKDEIERIENLGVKINLNKNLTMDDFNILKERFDGIYIGCGFGKSISPGFTGDNFLDDGALFLKEVESKGIEYKDLQVGVIGGGNTAIDLARSLIRTGAKVTILYRRRVDDMPAFEHEIEDAINEGVRIEELLSPTSVEKDKEQLKITLQKMIPDKIDHRGRVSVKPVEDESKTFIFDRIISGIGNEIKENWHSPPTDRAIITLKNSVMDLTDTPVVYGGDITNSNQSVTDAIASGKEMAMAMDLHFKGDDKVDESLSKYRVGNNSLSFEIYKGHRVQYKNIVEYKDINTDYFHKQDRAVQPRISKDESLSTFNEVAKTYSYQMASSEALRCFNCGVCNDCDNCRLFCPDASIEIEDEKRVIKKEFCKGCGVCVTECPRSAMDMEEEKI